jgi:hypothetical protein
MQWENKTQFFRRFSYLIIVQDSNLPVPQNASQKSGLQDEPKIGCEASTGTRTAYPPARARRTAGAAPRHLWPSCQGTTGCKRYDLQTWGKGATTASFQPARRPTSSVLHRTACRICTATTSPPTSVSCTTSPRRR